jgi:hypothetical protein
VFFEKSIFIFKARNPKIQTTAEVFEAALCNANVGRHARVAQGCQIFLDTIYQKW